MNICDNFLSQIKMSSRRSIRGGAVSAAMMAQIEDVRNQLQHATVQQLATAFTHAQNGVAAAEMRTRANPTARNYRQTDEARTMFRLIIAEFDRRGLIQH